MNANRNFKKSIMIGCGVAAALVIITVGFTNVGELIYHAGNDAISQVKISNPLATYKINTKCELSYRMLDAVHHGGHILTVPAMFYSDTELGQRMAQKYAHITNFDDKMSAINAEVFEISVKKTMESNSINPKFEPIIRMWISSFMGGQYENLQLPINSQDVMDDPECAKKMKMYYPQMVIAP